LPQYRYKRSAVPVGGQIRLETQFFDSAGNKKDPESFPTVEIFDGDGYLVRAASAASVTRPALGKFRLEYTIPDGYVAGVWTDVWDATVDGYALNSVFDFNVDPGGSIVAAGSTVTVPTMKIGDKPNVKYTQAEIYGINILMEMLRFRLHNTQFGRDGQRCDIFSIDEMLDFLRLALSEFNATPTFTSYTFADGAIYGIFADLIVEGSYLKAVSSIIPTEAAKEGLLTDNGITLTPASVSAALNNVHSGLYSEYRNRVKEAKRNHRPPPIGMGAGSILASSPLYRRLRARKENQLI
jgi:hypothetical protein